MPVDDVDTRPAPPRTLTRRERLRRQTVDEIVERALELVDSGGAHGLSIASVSKAMGMTPPALYHYFASRDALLDALVLAGYTDLGTAVEGAARAASDRPAAERVAAIAHAWRRWALDHPRRYAMLFTGSRRDAVDPLEHVGPITASMLALVTALQELVRDGGDGGDGGGRDGGADGGGRDGGEPGAGPKSGAGQESGARQGLDAELSRWGRTLGAPPETAPGALRLALSTWYRVHGLVSLELVGGFDTMGLDGGPLLTAEIESLVHEATR
ncbi:TetR/AcrR family transcriptional regulator [Promicromonospora sp. NPDC060204]|uniref:TetR/AcrR family transcriptional regulator n=1 Tax=Promicromonospora sp. NPDC060204 TaxID=3347071 RepID=UPI003661C31F